MPFDAEERERLIGVAQSYADSAAAQVRLTIEAVGSGVLIRGARPDPHGLEQVETLSLAWELVERSDAPERFLQTQVWAVEQGLRPAGSAGRPHP